MNQCFGGDWAERQPQATGLRLAYQKLLEQQRMRADAFGVVVGTERKQLVAERQKATWLQSDDRHAAYGERREGPDQPVQFLACLIDQAGREKRPPAIRRGKYAMRAIASMSFDESIAYTESQIALLAMTEDAKEGLKAFGEKRKPSWPGR